MARIGIYSVDCGETKTVYQTVIQKILPITTSRAVIEALRSEIECLKSLARLLFLPRQIPKKADPAKLKHAGRSKRYNRRTAKGVDTTAKQLASHH
jgi:hypothetical protein